MQVHKVAQTAEPETFPDGLAGPGTSSPDALDAGLARPGCSCRRISGPISRRDSGRPF